MAFLYDELSFVLGVVLDVVLDVSHQAQPLHVGREVESFAWCRLVVLA